MCFSIQIDRNVKRIAKKYSVEIDREAFNKHIEKRKENPKRWKGPDENSRVYPKYFAPVIIQENNHKILRPMRYQLLPNFSKDEQYCIETTKGKRKEVKTFNARIEALERRKAWKGLFMNKHCLIPLNGFYEWVVDRGRTRQIYFSPPEKEMWAVGLWDRWISDTQETIDSFAIITTTPREEVLRMGHDRSPIYLKKKYHDQWLRPQGNTKDRMYQLLQEEELSSYQYQWVD